MRAILLSSAWLGLIACADARPAWIVAHSDLYRVTSYSNGQTPISPDPYSPYFLVKKVVSSGSDIFGETVQYQFVWCSDRSTCNNRDYSLQIIEFGDPSDGDRVAWESGAQCTITRHVLSQGNITIQSDTYSSDDFTSEECEAGISAPLDAKFVQTASKKITGELIQRMGDED